MLLIASVVVIGFFFFCEVEVLEGEGKAGFFFICEGKEVVPFFSQRILFWCLRGCRLLKTIRRLCSRVRRRSRLRVVLFGPK